MFKSFETSFLLVFDLTSLENAFTCHHALGGSHGLGTPNEGINERYLKNLADVADKMCFGRI